LAGRFIEADDAFDFRLELMIGDEDSALRNRRSRVTRADSHSPADRKARSGDGVEDARLAPNPIAIRPAPLGPIIGSHSGNQQPQRQANGDRLKGSRANWVQGDVAILTGLSRLASRDSRAAS
jgi:hypothetical protein